MDKERPKYIPVRAYVLPTVYRKLKSKLALKGQTVSEWFRRKAQEEIDDV